MPVEVFRTVQFWRLYTRVEDGAIDLMDPALLCRAVAQIYARDDRYLLEPDTDVQVTAKLANDADRDRFLLCKIRRHSRPMTEQDGVLEPLRLAARKGLMDPIHVRLFNNNILGAEFNNDGPRITKLRPLLAEKLPEEYRTLRMVPIFDQTAVERLQRLEELTLFEATIDRAAIDAQIAVPNYMAGLIARSREVNSTVFEVVLRPKRGEHLDDNVLKENARALLGLGKALKKLKVRGTDPETDQTDEFDVFRDRVVSKKRMVRIDDEHRTIESASAFRAIEAAYNESLARIPEVQFIEG